MNQPPSVVAIRLAEPADAAAIAQLMQAEPAFWHPSWSPELIARTLAASTTIAFVTLAAAEPETVPLLASPAVQTQPTPPIAGFACAHNLGFRGYLSELIVAPSSRGQGHASALLAVIEQRLADEGCPLIIADVWRAAQEFYRQQGWTPPDAVLLRKHLPPAT
ncbi:GNAT family N-acetyltransferase [Lacipirellula sp.]|uniref:GNAT family N-acetyltransferase n=1 Tax=Lacipirellula sp. TaxID=2691419 RepID=UPI003D143136